MSETRQCGTLGTGASMIYDFWFNVWFSDYVFRLTCEWLLGTAAAQRRSRKRHTCC